MPGSWIRSFKQTPFFRRLRRRLHRPPREVRLADPVRLSVKSLGHRLALDLTGRLAATDTSAEPRRRGLGSKACTQADVESPWFAHWCRELHVVPEYHRKLWEYAFLLQVLHDRDMLRAGRRGLGFGCGEEPVASYLASRGVAATATDLAPDAAKGRGWMETGQHATRRDLAFRPDLVSREAFERLVDFAFVDMTDIPASLDGQYDFCWSLCAFEHLGTIEAGLRFVEQSMRTLRPGGLAIHTTEFNFLCQDDTIDEGSTVLFLAKHLTDLAARLERSGHRVGALDLDVGDGVVDRYVDVPPYHWNPVPQPGWNTGTVHLKLSLDAYPTTSFGLVVEKG